MQLWFSIFSFMKKWKHEGFMRIFFCVSNSCITVHPTFHYLSLLWIYLFETICQKILKVPTMQQTLSWVAFITTMNFWDLMPDKFLNLKIRKVMPRPFIGPKKLDLIKTLIVWEYLGTLNYQWVNTARIWIQKFVFDQHYPLEWKFLVGNRQKIEQLYLLVHEPLLLDSPVQIKLWKSSKLIFFWKLF